MLMVGVVWRPRSDCGAPGFSKERSFTYWARTLRFGSCWDCGPWRPSFLLSAIVARRSPSEKLFGSEVLRAGYHGGLGVTRQDGLAPEVNRSYIRTPFAFQ